MTKEELEQYIDLKKEIVQLQDDLEKKLNKKYPVLAGAVKTSSKHFPFITHEILIPANNPDYSEAVKKLIDINEKRLDECVRQTVQIEKFIDGIGKSYTRQIFRMRYIKGMKIKDIAEKMNTERSTISAAINRYLKKCHTNHKRT